MIIACVGGCKQNTKIRVKNEQEMHYTYEMYLIFVCLVGYLTILGMNKRSAWVKYVLKYFFVSEINASGIFGKKSICP